MNKEKNKPVGFLIKRISEKMEARGNNALRKYGLTFTQSRVLACLDQSGGRITQKELERQLGVSHPTVVGIVNRLERDGFVRTWQDENDRRVKNIESTEKSARVSEALDGRAHSDDEDLLSPFTDEEKKELTRLLTKLEEHLDDKPKAKGGAE